MDLSRVPYLAERQSVLKLVEQREAINAERYEAIKHLVAQMLRAMEIRSQTVRLAQQVYAQVTAPLDEQIKQIEAPFVERMVQLDERIKDTAGDLSLRRVGGSETGDISQCAVTGLPLLDDDEVWQHHDHGPALMCLLPPTSGLVGEECEADDGDVQQAAVASKATA